MRRLRRRLIVFVGVLGMVMALNVGVAFAHDAPPFEGVTAETAKRPVGNAMDSTDGKFKGFDIGNAVAGITHSPICPLHYLP
jgi:hypothetical protein